MTVEDLKELKGLVATINLTGSVMVDTMHSAMEMRAFNIENGFKNIEYQEIGAQLVEAGRDAACRHALKEGYDWVLQYDGDAVFGPDAVVALLKTAFQTVPQCHAVGAYAQLKQPPYLPVIDTGTGRWETHFPGEGILPCIRTGGHFILVKTPILSAMGEPWFRTRQTLRPIDALSEVDNYARMKLDGENPFAKSPDWKKLFEEASSEHGGVKSSVGEDSAFCDALRAAGGMLVVDTGVITGHVHKRIITYNDLRDSLKEIDGVRKYAVGVY